MQTLTFARALNEAVTRLRLTELLALLQKFFSSGINFGVQDEDKAKFSELAFNLRAEYYSLGGESNEILKTLALEDIMSSAAMGALIHAFQAAPNSATI